MKKIILALLIVTMSVALFGCNKDDSQVSDGTVSEEKVEFTDDSLTILTNVWNAFSEEEKFPAMGGDYATMVDGAPGAFDVTNTTDMEAMLYVPANIAVDVDEAATLLHGMNLNTFTGAALHLTDATKAESFTTALKDNILGTQWMCGFPDTLVIYTINGEYVVYAFGNVDAINSFKTKVMEVYGEHAVLVAEENLAG